MSRWLSHRFAADRTASTIMLAGRRASPDASGRLYRAFSGSPLPDTTSCTRPTASRARSGGGVLGACPPAVLHHGRCRGQRPPQGTGQDDKRDLAAGAGGGPADRCPVRDQTLDKRPERRAASGCPAGIERAAGRRSGTLDARAAGQALAWQFLLERWLAFTRFLDDGRICLSNNAAERALRGIALGRKSWLFAGSDRGF